MYPVHSLLVDSIAPIIPTPGKIKSTSNFGLTNLFNNKGKPLSKTTYPFLISFAALCVIAAQTTFQFLHFQHEIFYN